MGLLGLLKKKRTNSVGEDLDRLTPEGELPFGWMVYNKEIIKQMDKECSAFRSVISAAKNPKEKHAAIKSYLRFLEDGKKHYKKINVCAGKYFEEYCCDTPFVDKIQKQMKELEKQLKNK